MSRGVQRTEMRQELLECAAGIIERDGVAALTVSALATGANCAKGVLYNYFDNLDSLIAELVADTFGSVVTSIETIVANSKTRAVTDVLGAIAATIIDERSVRIAAAAFERPGVVALVMEQFANDEVPNLATITMVIAGYLRTEQKRGRVHRRSDADTLAYIFVCALHDQLQAARSSTPSTERVVAALFDPVIIRPAN